MSLIIGASGETPAPTKYDKALPEPEVDLPHPASAAEARSVVTSEQILRWLEHDSPLVRTFAVEQVSLRDEPEVLDALTNRVADEDELVAIEAVSVLEAKKHAAAARAIEDRFMEATGNLAAACASALGRLAPERLRAAVAQRRRLDDEGFAAVATSLAVMGGDETTVFLNKALNRAGVLGPERRGALYGAALLSGDPALAGRVIGVALEDSKKEAPEGGSYPSRASLAVLAGLPTAYSRPEEGLEVFDHAREIIEQEVLPELPEDDRAKLADAMKRKQAGEVLAALAPVLEHELAAARTAAEEAEVDAELGTMPRRRRGLLEALVKRAEAVGRLELKPAAIFVAAAAQAALVVLAQDLTEASSPAMIAISKALEGEKTPEEIAALDDAALTELFASKTDRDMRRVVTTMVREHFRRASTLRRFCKAVFKADHGPALVSAASEVDDPQVHAQIARAAEEDRAAAETTVVEMLEDRETETRAIGILLRLAEAVRTERVALVLGRRFFALREDHRGPLARAMLRTGDARLIPLLKSRAFDDEAEEVAWVVLALAHEVDRDEALDSALARTLEDRVAEDLDEAPKLRVPLRCEACGEINGYEFERAYVDVEAKDDMGDPAFVGDLVCKACGTTDRLASTPAAAHVLTNYMLEFLQAAEAGMFDGPPVVSPAQTEIGGKKMGLARALRELDADIEANPEAVRPRLHRARVKLILQRSGVEADLDAVLTAEPGSPEARALKATLLMRERRGEEAMQLCAEAARSLSGDEPPRLYDADSAERLLRTVEDYMVELELGDVTPPDDVDLEEARQRRADREEEAMRRQEAQYEAMARARGEAPPAPEAPAAVRRAPTKKKKPKKGKKSRR